MFDTCCLIGKTCHSKGAGGDLSDIYINKSLDLMTVELLLMIRISLKSHAVSTIFLLKYN